MRKNVFKNFLNLDENSFSETVRELGFAHASCFRINGQSLTFVIGSELPDGKTWPAIFTLDSSYYTSKQEKDLPIGWVRMAFKGKEKQMWPKGIVCYFPEQGLKVEKFMLVAVPNIRLRVEPNQLDGQMEALLNRIHTWVSEQEMRQFVNETIMAEHAKKLGLNTLTLVDHELRTPLSTINGFSILLKDILEKDSEGAELAGVIHSQVEVAIRAIEKLSSTIKAVYGSLGDDEEFEDINLTEVFREVCDEVKEQIKKEMHFEKQPEPQLLLSVESSDFAIRGVRKLVKRAFSEIIQNGLVYSEYKPLKITGFQMNDKLVIDIEDKGQGIPPGMEDLIFLQFFKGYNQSKVKRGHRGLGLGLYLAKSILESHFGELFYVRQQGKGGIFRIILPSVLDVKKEFKGTG